MAIGKPIIKVTIACRSCLTVLLQPPTSKRIWSQPACSCSQCLFHSSTRSWQRDCPSHARCVLWSAQHPGVACTAGGLDHEDPKCVSQMCCWNSPGMPEKLLLSSNAPVVGCLAHVHVHLPPWSNCWASQMRPRCDSKSSALFITIAALHENAAGKLISRSQTIRAGTGLAAFIRTLQWQKLRRSSCRCIWLQ